MVYYTIPSLSVLWLTIDAVEPSNDDNDDDSSWIINHEECEEEEEADVLVEDEPTSSRVAISPRSESPGQDDQTHLDVVDTDHELHAADRAAFFPCSTNATHSKRFSLQKQAANAGVSSANVGRSGAQIALHPT